MRAACPPEGLSDERTTRTVEAAVQLMESMPAPGRALLTAATALLEVSPMRRRFGFRRFSSLDRREARELLDSQTSPRSPAWRALALLRDMVVFAHFELPEVRLAVGYDPDPWIADRAAERLQRWSEDIDAHRHLLLEPAPLRSDPVGPRRREGAFRAGRDLPSSRLDCDVVVVGSGAGGSVVAAELAEAGLEVVVLEEGRHHRTEDFTTSTSQMLSALYRDSGVSTTLGRVPIAYSEGRCVGGSTVVNGAMAFRAPERVLDRWAAEAGVHDLARSGLDDEYQRVERFISATGQDAGSIGEDQRRLREGADKLGWQAIANVRAQVHCVGCNVCTWGCPTGAKQSTLVSYLPRAVAFGAMVWSECRVDRVAMRGKRAVGVSGRTLDADGRERTFSVGAKQVVVACGAIHTPALLQRSGIRTPSGQLGRNLVLHPGAPVVALFDERIDGWKGAHQAFQVRQFERDGIVLAAVNFPPSLVARTLPLNGPALGEAMSAYNHMVTAGVLVEDTASGRVRAMGRDQVLATYRLDDRDAERVVRATGAVV